MGYFANGTEGEMYEQQYCSRCIHAQSENGCTVWFLHMLHNYDECDKPHSFLHTLIPRGKDYGNEECRMFAPTQGKESAP